MLIPRLYAKMLIVPVFNFHPFIYMCKCNCAQTKSIVQRLQRIFCCNKGNTPPVGKFDSVVSLAMGQRVA